MDRLDRFWTCFGQVLDMSIGGNGQVIMDMSIQKWTGFGQEMDRFYGHVQNLSIVWTCFHGHVHRKWTGYNGHVHKSWTGFGQVIMDMSISCPSNGQVLDMQMDRFWTG